jgi:hypothetical protein
MPSAVDILAGLQAVTNRWTPIAIAWHVYVALLGLGAWSGLRPARSLAGQLITLPLLSVSVLAGVSGNPFNAVVFALLWLALLLATRRQGTAAVTIAPSRYVAVGLMMIGFGWMYPHFLDTASPAAYFYAAPLGLIPCPTLAMVTGASLVAELFGSRRVGWILVVADLFYATVGIMQLGVSIDAVLLLGAVVILARTVTFERAGRSVLQPGG